MIKCNGKVLTYDGKWLNEQDNVNPLELPPFTIRVKTNGSEPLVGRRQAVLTQVDSDIWDVYLYDRNWSELFMNGQNSRITEVLGASTLGVTNMAYMFAGCNGLTKCAVFNTTNVKDFNHMFNEVHLDELPLLDTSNGVNLDYMFRSIYMHDLDTFPLYDLSKAETINGFCSGFQIREIPDFNVPNVKQCISAFSSNYNAETGILRMYNKLSALPALSSVNSHYGCFADTGRDTESGVAELAQIPADWK